MTPLEKTTEFLARVLFCYRNLSGADVPTPNVNDGTSLERHEEERSTLVDAHWRFPGDWELLLTYDTEGDSFAFYGDQFGKAARRITWGDATPEVVAAAILMLVHKKS